MLLLVACIQYFETDQQRLLFDFRLIVCSLAVHHIHFGGFTVEP